MRLVPSLVYIISPIPLNENQLHDVAIAVEDLLAIAWAC